MDVVVFILLVIAFFDIYWIIRLVITKLVAKYRSRIR